MSYDIPLCTQSQLAPKKICSERAPYPAIFHPFNYLFPYKACIDDYIDDQNKVPCSTPLSQYCEILNTDPNISYAFPCLTDFNNNIYSGEPLLVSGGTVTCVQNKWDKANFNGCCSGRINTVEQCDPNWCPISGNDMCADRMINDPLAVCRDDVTDPDCIRYCSTVADGQTKVTCDNLFIEYCHNNTDKRDPLCGCITPNFIVNTDSLFDRVGFCFSSSCNPKDKLEVYQTNDITETLKTCTADTICQTAFNCIANSTCDIQNNKVNSNCGPPPSTSTGSSTGTSTGTQLPSSGTSTEPTTVSDDDSIIQGFSNIYLYIIIAIVVIIIIIIIVLVVIYV